MIIIVRTRDGNITGAHRACCQDNADRQLSQPGDGELWTAVEVGEAP